MTTAVMVSGGLDSYIAWRCAPPTDKVAVWVNLGQPYAQKEWNAIMESDIPARAVTVENMYHNQATIDNWIIPGRNLLLSLIGAQFGEVVWLSALDGEMHKYAREKDKTPEFFHLTSGILTYVMDIVRPETRVETPFSTKTKSEIVGLALKNGVKPHELTRTSSCYHETLRNCGLCGTCFKRWIAMINNMIEEPYANPPWEGKYAKESIQGMKDAIARGDFSHYSWKRIKETQFALESVGIRL